MINKETKRDLNTYHLVSEEKKKIDVVNAILKTLRTKKTHKYHPSSITELAKKVHQISKEYIHTDGNSYVIGKSTLLREKGKYRVLLEGFFASLSGADIQKLNVSNANEEALRVMVRSLQYELAETKREKKILTLRIQHQEGSTFGALPESNHDELKKQQDQQQELHDAYKCIFNILSYLDKERIALLNFTQSGLVEQLTEEVIIQKNYTTGYVKWLEENSQRGGSNE